MERQMKTRMFTLVTIAAVSLVMLALTLPSTAQNTNSSTTTNRNQSEPREITAPMPKSGARGGQDFSTLTWELPEGASRTKNPVASSSESISKGKDLYLAKEKGNCVFCHGEAGSGNEANLPKLHRKPADLTDKERMSSMTDGEIFWKVTRGINGIMPAGERRMTEEERWHVVNYVRTLVKEPVKP